MSLSNRAASIERRLGNDDSLSEIDVVLLTEAFDAWCVASHPSNFVEAIAA